MALIGATSAIGAQWDVMQRHAVGASDDWSWRYVYRGLTAVRDMAALGRDEVWGVGPDGVLAYDGDSWRVVHRAENGVSAISMVDSAYGWAAKSGGGLLFYDGAVWLDVAFSLPDVRAVLDLVLRSRRSGWAVAAVRDERGLWGTAFLRKEESGWVDSGARLDGRFTSIDVIGDNDAWAAGGSGIAHFDGESWDLLIPDVPFWAIEMAGGDEGWAVGGVGGPNRLQWRQVIYRYEDKRWIAVVDGPGKPLYAVAAGQAGSVVAGGLNGLIMVYDGAAWTELTELGGGHFSGVRAIVHVPDTDSFYLGLDGLYPGQIVVLEGPPSNNSRQTATPSEGIHVFLPTAGSR